MAVYIIFTFCNLLTLAIFFGFYHGCAKPNGQMLLTVTIPKIFLNDIEVTKITEEYKKKCTIFFFVFLLIALSFYFLREYTAVSAFLLLLFCFIVYAFYCILLEHYRKKLLALKKQRNWFVSKTHILSIDTEASRLKNTFPLSHKHFVLPIFIAAFPCLIYFFCEENIRLSNIICAISVAFVMLSGILMYEIFTRLPSKAYCENSEANIALNRSYKYECSKMCVGIMYSGAAMLPMVITSQTSGDYLFAVLFSGALSTAICFIAILIAYFNVRRQRNKFMALIEKSIEIDEDEYWHYGLYYNPCDSKVFVESRIGFGLEVNFAKTASKIMVLIVTAILVWVFWLFITILPLDFIKSFELKQSDNTFTISAPLYNDSFTKDDIASIQKLTEINNASRTNGAETSKLMLGNFDVDGFGKARMYIIKDVELYVCVNLKNGTYVFINGADIAETERFYEMLKN